MSAETVQPFKPFTGTAHRLGNYDNDSRRPSLGGREYSLNSPSSPSQPPEYAARAPVAQPPARIIALPIPVASVEIDNRDIDFLNSPPRIILSCLPIVGSFMYQSSDSWLKTVSADFLSGDKRIVWLETAKMTEICAAISYFVTVLLCVIAVVATFVFSSFFSIALLAPLFIIFRDSQNFSTISKRIKEYRDEIIELRLEQVMKNLDQDTFSRVYQNGD